METKVDMDSPEPPEEQSEGATPRPAGGAVAPEHQLFSPEDTSRLCSSSVQQPVGTLHLLHLLLSCSGHPPHPPSTPRCSAPTPSSGCVLAPAAVGWGTLCATNWSSFSHTPCLTPPSTLSDVASVRVGDVTSLLVLTAEDDSESLKHSSSSH